MRERERRRNFVKWLMKRAIRHTFHLYTFTQCQFFMVFLLFMTHPKIFLNNYFPFSILHSRSTKFFHWILKVLFVMFSACLSMKKILPFFLLEAHGEASQQIVWIAKVKTHHSSEEFFMAANYCCGEKETENMKLHDIEDVSNSCDEI